MTATETTSTHMPTQVTPQVPTTTGETKPVETKSGQNVSFKTSESESKQATKGLNTEITETSATYIQKFMTGINQQKQFNIFGRSGDGYNLGTMFTDPNSSVKLQLAFTKSIQRNVSDSNNFKGCSSWINEHPLPNDYFKQMPGGKVIQIKDESGNMMIPQEVYCA